MTRGDRNIAWIEQYCRVPEGKFVGQKVVLRPFQRKIVKGIYDSPTRRGIISFGRKNAKTALAAFLVLLHLCGPEARANSQLYSAAQVREQAAILFGYAAKCIRMSPDLVSVVQIRDSSKTLLCPELGTTYRALSADAAGAYGLSPALAIHDELGQVRGPTSPLYDAIETAAGAQEEPLSIIISTQAPDDNDLLSRLIDDALTGADPLTKLFMFCAPDDCDPFSDEAIKAANPAYGDFLNAAEVHRTAEQARRMPSQESAYRNLILNQRVNQHDPFVSRTVWSRGDREIDHSLFLRRPVYVGLDLSARNDLCALVSVADDERGMTHIRPEFFAPLMGVAERAHRDRAPYDVWAKKGYLTLTPGASVAYEHVAARLVQICDESDVVLVAFDRWRIDVLRAELSRLGVELPLAPFGQGYQSMAPALDEFEQLLLNEHVFHGGHPVLRWCAANAIVTKDPAGNRKLDKSKATGRIDGMVATAMAVGVRAGSIPEDDISSFLSDPLIAA